MEREKMKAYLKKADPRFATDDYLDSLSDEALCEYYCECCKTETPAADDWGIRLERARWNNR